MDRMPRDAEGSVRTIKPNRTERGVWMIKLLARVMALAVIGGWRIAGGVARATTTRRNERGRYVWSWRKA